MRLRVARSAGAGGLRSVRAAGTTEVIEIHPSRLNPLTRIIARRSTALRAPAGGSLDRGPG